MNDDRSPPDMLQAALGYLEAGYDIIPSFSIAMLGDPESVSRSLGGGGPIRFVARRMVTKLCKTPLRPAFIGNHLRDAEEVSRWFTRYPLANISICMGPRSKVVVLDVDFYRGAELALPSLGLPDTRRVSTGNGEHHYFRHPGGDHVTRHRILGRLSLIGDAYNVALAPPSLHPSGPRYRWINPATPIAPLPPSLAALATTRLRLSAAIRGYKTLRYQFRSARCWLLYHPILWVYLRWRKFRDHRPEPAASAGDPRTEGT